MHTYTGYSTEYVPLATTDVLARRSRHSHVLDVRVLMEANALGQVDNTLTCHNTYAFCVPAWVGIGQSSRVKDQPCNALIDATSVRVHWLRVSVVG